MKTLLKLLATAAAVIMTVTPGIAKEKIFFDSKSWIVPVAGNPEILTENGLSAKVVPVDFQIANPLIIDSLGADGRSTARWMTDAGYGRKFVDYLTENGQNDVRLKELALKNAQIREKEFGEQTLVGGENEEQLKQYLMDQYEPILMHLYYCFSDNYSRYVDKYGDISVNGTFSIYKVKITKEEAFDIIANIGNPEVYNKFHFPVEYVCGGEIKKLEKIITKKAPDLALRGVLLRRHPARISIGENAGIEKGDLVSIYSQRRDKNGNDFSKRISRARVHGVWENEAQINFEANTAGNKKNGDVVVRTPDKKTRLGVLATWLPHNWGAMILGDTKLEFTRSGIIHHLIYELSYSLTDKPGQKFVSREDGSQGRQYVAPMFFNAGLGYGIGKTFLGYLDIMPYFMGQVELASMSGDINGFYLRAPIGLRFSFNTGYPVKLTLEAGWAFNFALNQKSQNCKNLEWAMKYLSSKRNGIYLNLGFIF